MPHIAETWSDRLTSTAARLPAPVAELVTAMIAIVGRDAEGAQLALESAKRQGAPDQLVDDLVSTLVLAFGLAQWTTIAWRTMPTQSRGGDDNTDDTDHSDVVRSARSHDVRTAIAEHFADTDDEVPPPVEALIDRLPELAELYSDTRRQLFTESGQADPALRELLLAVISARAGYVAGGTRHLRRAYAFGLPRGTLRMVLTATALIEGAVPWTAYGRTLWLEPDA